MQTTTKDPMEAGLLRVSRLPVREKMWLMHAGYTATPWPVCAARLIRGVLDGIGARGHHTPEERTLLEKELADVSRRKREKEARLEAARGDERENAEVTDTSPIMPAEAPASWPRLLFAIVLLAAEASFILWALADYLGIDLERIGEDTSILTPVLLLAATVGIVLINMWLGGKAIAALVPLNRLLARFALLLMAVAVGYIRLAASPDDSMWFALLGTAVTLVGGLAAGLAHQQLAEAAKVRSVRRTLESATAGRQDARQGHIGRLAAEFHGLELRERQINEDLVAISREADWREHEGEYLERVKAARLADGLYYYNLGAHYGGHPKVSAVEVGCA